MRKKTARFLRVTATAIMRVAEGVSAVASMISNAAGKVMNKAEAYSPQTKIVYGVNCPDPFALVPEEVKAAMSEDPSLALGGAQTQAQNTNSKAGTTGTVVMLKTVERGKPT